MLPSELSVVDEATLAGKRVDILLDAYREVCASYHAIDEFRAKLLGILPLASLAGILAVGKEGPFEKGSAIASLIGFASFFAAAFTLALFLFEIRGILRCHHLIHRGKELEEKLQVLGQFAICSHQHERTLGSLAERLFNAKVAASAMYSLVFSAWLFLGLHFSFGITIIGCGVTATAVGGVLAVGAYRLLSAQIAA